MKTLRISKSDFMMAFEEDADFEQAGMPVNYLDLETGEIDLVYEDDHDAYMYAGLDADENRLRRERYEGEPDRYLLIEGQSHGDHHELLQMFLCSDWTADKALLKAAQDTYTGSIGRWKKEIRDRNVIHAFYDYRSKRLEEWAVAFLNDLGIQPEWKP